MRKWKDRAKAIDGEATLFVVFLGALAFAVGVFWVQVTQGDEYLPLDSISRVPKPTIKPLECGLQRETPESAYLGSKFAPNGLEYHYYDTNGDGVRDVVIAIPQGDENRYPLLYSFDNTYDGQPDITWIDRLRDGTCGNVGVYWYRGQKEPESSRKEGEIADCINNDCNKRKEGEL